MKFCMDKRPLYKKKRSSKLSKILEILRIFEQFKLKENPKNLFIMLKVDFEKSAISYVLDLIRVDGLSSEVADLSICGAIPPYNEILCGKLTCLISGYKKFKKCIKRDMRIQYQKFQPLQALERQYLGM